MELILSSGSGNEATKGNPAILFNLLYISNFDSNYSPLTMLLSLNFNIISAILLSINKYPFVQLNGNFN